MTATNSTRFHSSTGLRSDAPGPNPILPSAGLSCGACNSGDGGSRYHTFAKVGETDTAATPRLSRLCPRNHGQRVTFARFATGACPPGR